MEILQQLREKCKSREFIAILSLILVGFGSFGLGRLSKIEESREPISIIYPDQIDSSGDTKTASVSNALPQIQTSLPAGGQVVASKNGTKYYLPWCAGVSKISETNKVWFKSEEEAKGAGYGPAANCKGIK